MKQPSFQFYPGDWQSNKNLRRCTHAEKGIWLEVMCLMHDSEEYGILRWPLTDVAQAVGCRLTDLQALRNKAVLKGAEEEEICPEFVYVPRSGRKDGEPVLLVPAQPGPIWYSSRMVKDEYLRGVRGDTTRFTKDSPTENKGRPIGAPKGAPISDPSGDGSSSSSSSPSSSSNKKTMSTDSIGSDEPIEPDETPTAKSPQKPPKTKPPKLEPKFGEEARTLASTLYDHLKEHGALPAAKDFFVRQALVAEELLKKHQLSEWIECLEWSLTEAYHRQRISNLRYLGDVAWPQYAKRNERGSQPIPRGIAGLQAAYEQALREETEGHDEG